ncbi:uncharacterized protein V6R79_001404 [Siganus canaliculatus]
MPRLQSGVWKHFTSSIKDGREAFMCNYCSKTYTKNATKMQMHLDKCKEYSVVSQQSPGPDGSSSASIPVPSFSFSPSTDPGGRFLIDSVDQRSQAYADEYLARAVYATSSPLALTENVYWKRFFSVLRPAYCPPTREALSSHLLDCEYSRVQSQVQEAVLKADSVAVMCSGLSNIKQTGYIIYMVATPVPLVYRCSKTTEQTQLITFIAEELKDIISEVGPQKVFSVVTDDSPEMTSVWAEIEKDFPHISAIGCTASAIQRLFDDIAAQPSIKELCRRAEEVVQHVKEQKVLTETFENWQTTKNANETTLKLPVILDYNGVVSMLDSLLEGQDSLRDMAVSPTLDFDASVRATVQDAAFWKGLTSSRNLLCLIGNHLNYIKREDTALSGVVHVFTQLRYHIRDVLSESVLHSTEQEAVMATLDRCQQFCVKPIHTAAYMLDPKHAGKQTLSGEQVNSAYYVISNLSHHLNLDEGKVLASFARFSAKQGLWKGAGIWSSCQHVSASTWWKGLCSSEPLSAVAWAILQIPPTTTACQSVQLRFSDATVQKSVSADRLQKLVAVQVNINLLEPSDFEFAPLESEEEENVPCPSATPW